MVAHVDQKTKSTNGIICDICGQVYLDKFEYYSAKFDLVEVDRAVGKTGIKQIDRRYLDLDFCPICMDTLKHKVIENIKKRESSVWSATTQQPIVAKDGASGPNKPPSGAAKPNDNK